MNMKEDSSFLQGVESRLDSLFGEDTQLLKAKDPGPPKETVAKGVDVTVAADMVLASQEDVREIPVVKEQSLPADTPSDKIANQDKSTFISEIEKRFSAIFGDEDKDTGQVEVAQKRAEAPLAAPVDVPIESVLEPVIEPVPEAPVAARVEPSTEIPVVVALPQQEKSADVDLDADEAPAPMSSIFNSPLKDMKSIVLSIEWEISDQILGQFEDEVNKLYLLYTGDRIVQGFLRILRFLGRYIRVRGVSSNQDSITLLLSVYDHLESVMISEVMTEARKHVILIDNIKKYRAWVENTDIETYAEGRAKKFEVEETDSLALEPLEQKTSEEPQGEEVEASAEEMPVIEDKPQAPAAVEEIRAEEPLRLELSGKEEAQYAIKEPDILIQARPEDVAEAPLSVPGDQAQTDVMGAMKDMPPHEAFAYALAEVKKDFQTQLDALKEEIRMLKGGR